MRREVSNAPVRRLIGSTLSVALVAAVIVLGITPASAVTRKALINGATVSGSPSQEEQIATAAGFMVTVIDDATWATYTASDFGQYDLLIAGDPNCGDLPPGLVSSAAVFGPVVLGLAGGRTSAGNRIVVGTDPVLHDGGDYSSPDARGTIIREGIGYAGSVPGTTGMYFDSTCAANYSGQSAETLSDPDVDERGCRKLDDRRRPAMRGRRVADRVESVVLGPHDRVAAGLELLRARGVPDLPV